MFLNLLCAVPFAFAQQPTENSDPLRINLNVGGMAIGGNLTQYQISGGGLISYNQEKYGNDLVMDGYRLWIQPPGTEELRKIGDDVDIFNIPFYYVRPKIYVQGFGEYSFSQLHQIDHRFVSGASVGLTPIRQEQQLFRTSLGAFWEYTSYPSEDFNIDVSQDGSARSIPRIGVIGNGWYRVPNKMVSFRYVGWFFINPLLPRDYRYRVNASGNIHITPVVTLRLSTTYEYNSVVMVNISEYDIRTNVGVGISFPPKVKK